MSREDYNEGFEDGVTYTKENYISQDDLMDSFDKFLDLINKHIYILRSVRKHFDGIGVDDIDLETKKEIEHNAVVIKTMIDTALKQTMKKEKSYESNQKK